MTAPAVRLDIAAGLATLTFNRPEAMNALSPELRAGFIDAVERLAQTPGLRCVVMRGAGTAFMAGGDVKGYHRRIAEDRAALADDLKERIPRMNRAIEALRGLPVPVLASVHGAAAGAGMSLMMACDLAIAADDTVFTLAYARIGTSPDCSGSFFLPRLVGLRRAMRIALLSERIDAATAQEIGLINWVVPAAELEAETARIAQKLAAAPTRALAATKALLNQSLDTSLAEQLTAETENFVVCALSDDFAEGVAAFVDKRKPLYRGG